MGRRTLEQKQNEMHGRLSVKIRNQKARMMRKLEEGRRVLAELDALRDRVREHMRETQIDIGEYRERPELFFPGPDDREVVRRHLEDWKIAPSRFAREIGVLRQQVVRVISERESVQVSKQAFLKMLNEARVGLPPKSLRELRREGKGRVGRYVAEKDPGAVGVGQFTVVNTGYRTREDGVKMHGDHTVRECTGACR